MAILWRERWIWIAADTRARDDDECWLDEEANSCIGPDGEWVAMEDGERVGDADGAHPIHGIKNKWETWFR
jgi:hypothetical protein